MPGGLSSRTPLDMRVSMCSQWVLLSICNDGGEVLVPMCNYGQQNKPNKQKHQTMRRKRRNNPTALFLEPPEGALSTSNQTTKQQYPLSPCMRACVTRALPRALAHANNLMMGIPTNKNSSTTITMMNLHLCAMIFSRSSKSMRHGGNDPGRSGSSRGFGGSRPSPTGSDKASACVTSSSVHSSSP